MSKSVTKKQPRRYLKRLNERNRLTLAGALFDQLKPYDIECGLAAIGTLLARASCCPGDVLEKLSILSLHANFASQQTHGELEA